MSKGYHIILNITEEEKWNIKQLAAKEHKKPSQLVTELVREKLKEGK